MKTDLPDQAADGIYLGLMSGTSMDGVDGVAVQFTDGKPARIHAEASIAFPDELRAALFALQTPGANEIEHEALAANELATLYAACCTALLRSAGLPPTRIRAIGVHGQTIRHRPRGPAQDSPANDAHQGMAGTGSDPDRARGPRGYTRQTNNPALLAELTNIDVISDFRQRDIAAGGEGAPLACAFHATIFSVPAACRVVCNLGGISNITILAADGDIRGFDCGPANALLDYWAVQKLGTPYDAQGAFAARGKTDAALLAALLDEPFFRLAPPKSTGRDLFNPQWLDAKLVGFSGLAAADVQATLVELTAVSVADAIRRHAPDCGAVYVCGGGARNPVLLASLAAALKVSRDPRLPDIAVEPTDSLGVPAQQVEALAFAWLAMRFVQRLPGNAPCVTGARGPRVLGALYPK